MGAGLSMAWMGVMIGVMLCYAVIAFVRRTGQPDRYDQEMVFSDTDFRCHFSHSVSQVKWGLIEDFEETSNSFQLRRLARYWLIPKRVLGVQVEQVRELFQDVKGQPLGKTPVELYSQIYGTESPFAIHRFRYHPDDLSRALKSNFRLAESNVVARASGVAVNLRWVIGVALLMAVIFLSFTLLEPGHKPSSVNSLLLVATWASPIVLLLGYVKLRSLFRHQRTGEIPLELSELRLTETGWAIGNPAGVVLFDWRDVDGIYESPEFYGFKTVNQLLNLIPRRIFADQGVANRFLAEALELHRRSKMESEISLATVVETGNPYQAPLR
jgi:hypothetical protein